MVSPLIVTSILQIQRLDLKEVRQAGLFFFFLSWLQHLYSDQPIQVQLYLPGTFTKKSQCTVWWEEMQRKKTWIYEIPAYRFFWYFIILLSKILHNWLLLAVWVFINLSENTAVYIRCFCKPHSFKNWKILLNYIQKSNIELSVAIRATVI